MTRWWKTTTAFSLKLAVLFVFSSASFSQTPQAAPKNCKTRLQEAVQALNADTQGVLISEQERLQIQKIFEDPKKSPRAAGYVFELLMEKRLAFLPPQDAEKIRKIIQTAKSDPSGGHGGFYDYESRSITITIPQTYHGSIVEFFIKAHEIEHAIQDLAKAGALGKKSLGYFQRLLSNFDPQIRFLEEAGAMQAEWQYLQALPTEIKIRLAREIKESTQLNNAEKTVFNRVLLNDAWTASDHLESEWDSGRYTLSEIEHEVKVAKIAYGLKTGLKTITVGSASAASILAAVLGAESVCKKARDQSLIPSNGATYQNICVRLLSTEAHH